MSLEVLPCLVSFELKMPYLLCQFVCMLVRRLAHIHQCVRERVCVLVLVCVGGQPNKHTVQGLGFRHTRIQIHAPER